MPTDALRTRLANRLLRDEALSRYTVARLGGPADWLYVAQESIEELAEYLGISILNILCNLFQLRFCPCRHFLVRIIQSNDIHNFLQRFVTP